jgi:hypothetical protein
MGLLSVLWPKMPERYEDIAAFESGKSGPFRKWRLILFFFRHPDEFEQYKRDWETRMVKKTGKELFAAYSVNPRKKLREAHREMRELRKKIRAAQKERRELLSQVENLELSLSSASGKEVY